MHAKEADVRAVAKTRRTLKETVNDPNVGASNEEMTMGGLSQLARMC